MEEQTILFLIVALISVVIIIYILRASISEFDINMGKGLFNFKGKTVDKTLDVAKNQALKFLLGFRQSY